MKIVDVLKACCGLLGVEPKGKLNNPIAQYKLAIKIALGKIPDEFYLSDSCCKQPIGDWCNDWSTSKSAEAPASCHKCPHFDHGLYEIKLKEYKDITDNNRY